MKNIIEDLKSESLNYTMVRKLLSDLKEEFGGGYNKTIKIAELKKIEQESKIMEKFVQKFRRVVRESSYERRPLVEEFKRKMDGMIIEVKQKKGYARMQQELYNTSS